MLVVAEIWDNPSDDFIVALLERSFAQSTTGQGI